MLEQNLINYYEVTRQTKTTRCSAANRGLSYSHCCFLPAPTETLYICGLLYITWFRVWKVFYSDTAAGRFKRGASFSCWLTVCPLFFILLCKRVNGWMKESQLVRQVATGELMARFFWNAVSSHCSLTRRAWLLASSLAQRMFPSLKWCTTRAKKRSYRA